MSRGHRLCDDQSETETCVMPFIKSKVSVPLSKEQETEIKTKMGKAIELVPGKSETYLRQ